MPTDGPLFEGAISVYGDAFARPPYNDPDRGQEIKVRLKDTHAQRTGFAGFCAVDNSGEVLGMTYGYRGEPGLWWHDAVVRSVDREAAREWLSDTYEVVEIAVSPNHQGNGIGEALLRRLLEGRPEATSVLSTRTDSRAHVLYSRLGFQVINEMRFSPGGAWFYIMGVRLPLPVVSESVTTER